MNICVCLLEILISLSCLRFFPWSFLFDHVSVLWDLQSIIINDNHSLHLPTFQHGCFHIHPGLSIYFLICSTEDPGQHLKASDSTRAPLFSLGRVWRNNYFMFTRLLRLFPTMDQCHTCLGTFRLFTNIPYQTVSKLSAWHGCEAIEGWFGLPSIQKWPWLNTDPFESQPCSRSVCGTTRQLSS